MKRLIIVLVILIVFGLSLPVSNLVVGLPENSLRAAASDDPLYTKAMAVLGAKCVNCHTPEYNLPFYATFPVARGVIEHDIRTGLQFVNYLETLLPKEGAPVSEVILAKTEQVIVDKSMPPMRYLALHWNGGLSKAEQETVLAWIHDVRAKHYATKGVAPKFKHEMAQPLPDVASLNLDARKVALGNKLFHDKRLSTDNSLACAGCHDLEKGGTDQARFSTGVGGAVGDINAPTVFNAGFQFMQFWDGRAADLQEQADGPVTNPIEMASNWEEAIPKLQQDEALTQEFLAVYPEGYSKDTITEAIAVFEESLITPSRFDQYLRGKEDALTADEKRGYALFKDLGCATCHAGKILGGQSFEKMGLYEDYFADRGNPHTPDFGRFNFTQQEADRFHLKVPTLRNIAITFPYLHDGTTSDLKEVVNIMVKYQTPRASISGNDADLIVAFLNALTGEYEGKQLQ